MDEPMEIIKEVSKEIAKDAYSDIGRPIAQPTGELFGLVPRAVKAALAPLELWVLQKEYNVAETKKLLEEKLNNVPPELIQSPEAHIAVPALQYISYCMDNDELRDMYANLLANSMNCVVKNGVHPGFVEIIKQLCPDEAKILRYFSHNVAVPTITLRFENDRNDGVDVVKNFSNVGEITGCEHPYDFNKYFNNLIRLGLLENAQQQSLIDKALYEPLKAHKYILASLDRAVVKKDYNKSRFKESFMSITYYGQSFCEICIGPTEVVIVSK